MEFDTLKNDINTLDKLASASQNTRQYYRVLKRRFIIETFVSFVALLFVIALMVFGDSLMAKIIFEFSLSEHISGLGNVNALMMFSCILMIIYCVVTPVQLWRSIMPDESLSWSLTDRVKSEIEKLTVQQGLWEKSPIWSFLPAIFIGVSFFWGLQFSLLGTWVPSIYLLSYFALIIAMTAGGFWLKKQMLQNEIAPLIQELQTIDRELVALGKE
jgi:succinate dehydrogenase hydrophobic anchor subunit